jgi:hypothetical protein
MLAPLAALAAGCALAPPEPDREVFGVSADRPTSAANAPADAAVNGVLEWKASQLCTIGWNAVRDRVDPAEDNLQMVDRELRCTPYRLGLPYVGTWPGPMLTLFGP